MGKQTVKRLLERGRNPLDARVLVMGLTFKEDVADIRNTKVVDVIRELESYNVAVDVVDPMAEAVEVHHEYGIALRAEPLSGGYDAVVVAVGHAAYRTLGEADFRALLKGGDGVVVDVKGMYRGRLGSLGYWSL